MTDTPGATTLLVAGETHGLSVRSRDGDTIGTMKAFMINKRTGQSTYAVLSLGGFLGLNKSYYPLPFGLLAYDPADDIYTVTVDRRLLEGGPSWANHEPEFNQAYADRVSRYYGEMPAEVG